MTFKQQIHHHFLQLVNNKINQLQQVLHDLRESGANETKSTAGDKYETALAMLQIEQDNTRAQLQEVLQQKAVLQKIDPAISTVAVVNGSVVKTGQGYFFISAALGKAEISNCTVTALSSSSPLGKQFMHLQKGDSTRFNNREYTLEDIL
ncbi:MAG: hypothetical protein U0V75_17375 [Ferruginibacter sp.]